MGLFSLIPLNTHLFDPIKMALSDLSFNDLAYSRFKKQKDGTIDPRIVIVDIGQADRGTIAATIAQLNQYQPKTIGLDITFDGPRDTTDAALVSVVQQTPRLVLAEKIAWDHEERAAAEHPNYFKQPGSATGYINFVGEKNGVIRHYTAAETSGDTMYYSFAALVLKQAAPEQFKQFTNDPGPALITYRRNATAYMTISYQDVLAGKVESSLFNGKIVLIGYANNNPNDIEDKLFTPLNPAFAGKSIPDLNGIYIHANILSMALDNDYTRKIPGWVMGIITVLVVWLHMSFFIKYYIEKHIWFHLVVKTVQLISAVLFIYLGILLISAANLQANFVLMLGGIVLAVDVLYFYEGLAQWMKKKFKINTIFGSHH